MGVLRQRDGLSYCMGPALHWEKRQMGPGLIYEGEELSNGSATFCLYSSLLLTADMSGHCAQLYREVHVCRTFQNYFQQPTYQKGIKITHGESSHHSSRRKRHLHTILHQQGLFSCWELNKTKFPCNSLSKLIKKPGIRSDGKPQCRESRGI
jgi:hypothetical protein